MLDYNFWVIYERCRGLERVTDRICEYSMLALLNESGCFLFFMQQMRIKEGECMKMMGGERKKRVKARKKRKTVTLHAGKQREEEKEASVGWKLEVGGSGVQDQGSGIRH